MVAGCSNQSGGEGIMPNQIGEEEILEGMSDFIELHPTENLEDFFDKEGLIDDAFPEGDKGVWKIYTVIAKENDGVGYSDEVFVEINRNNREIAGKYIEREIRGPGQSVDEIFPLVYKNGHFELKNHDDEINFDDIESFKLLVQLVDVNENYFETKEQKSMRYVSQRPLYSLYYELSEEDENLKVLMEAYGIEEIDQPVIQLYGNGPLEGSSLNQRQMNLILKEDRSLVINSSVTFRPESSVDNE